MKFMLLTSVSRYTFASIFNPQHFAALSRLYLGLVRGKPHRGYYLPPPHTHTHLGCSRQTLPTWLERLTPCQDISHPGQESTLADFLSYAKVLDPACEKSPGHHLKACFSWKALRFLQVARVTQTLREECRKLGVNYRTNMGSIWQFVNLAI